MKSYMGKILCINLSNGEFHEEAINPIDIRKYIGGRGLGTKLFWDVQPPKVDPLSPENHIVVATGPITGSLVPGGSKYVIITKSPATNGYTESYASGMVSYSIKGAGYDALVIHGKCQKPSCLVIDNGEVMIKNAGELWGQDAFAAERKLKEQFGVEYGTMCIGPAGEKLAPIAGVNSDFHRQAARGGVGAVFGSKNLKAVVVRGTRFGISCHDVERVMELQREHRSKMAANPIGKVRMKYGTPYTLSATNAIGMLPTRNFTTGHYDSAEEKFGHLAMEEITIRDKSCIGCIEACSKVTKLAEGPYKGLVFEGPEYETLALFGSNMGIESLSGIIKCNEICDRLGMDTISAGNTIAFVMECYEKGLIGKENLDGIELRFGNIEAVHTVLEKMGNREGVGYLLSQGVKHVSEFIGQGSQKFAMHVKGLEIPAYEPRACYGGALAYALSPRGACHRRCWPHAKDLMDGNPFSAEGMAEKVIKVWDETSIYHILLFCDFQIKHAKLSMKDVCNYYEALVGEEMSVERLLTITARTETLIRLYNNREGFTRADDTLPERCFTERIPDGPTKGILVEREAMNRMLDEYYELRGWDKNGIPLPQTIEKLEVF